MLTLPFLPSSKIDCKETNGYTTANIKPDLGATTPSTPSMTGWGAGGPVRPAVCTPDMTRYTPSTADQVARDRAWMNTCSSLASQAAQVSNVLIYRKQLHYPPPQATDATIQTWPQPSHYHLIAASIAAP